ncbi:MAG: single-stranded-DNA-specific exonuclease RecJ [Candidatus Andersenbacteria bacterium]|nr:single-stranded-DNA-specific exonuclease RecJ [bacterium]MDZ4225607.1 single-stranded-DNA-specific exonuclease RecJ [Candidatus Andersenbacteria bacterium]
MNRQWVVTADARGAISSTEELRGFLLVRRGVGADGAAGFFRSSYKDDIHDPGNFPDMAAGVDRIFRAIKDKEQIIVYGDYDADGISSTAILVETLREHGARVSPYIPHRIDDGYGLNKEVLERLAPEMSLLVTVDCGVTAAEEVKWLKRQKIDTVIVDHHTPGRVKPAAVAIIHPNYPVGSYSWPYLCGAGTAWKVAQALSNDNRSVWRGDTDRVKWLLDLAMLGTLGDSVPVLGENRAIVRFGLDVLRRTKRVGLRKLIDFVGLAGKEVSTEDVVFKIVPMLNAAGRMDHAQPALELLMTKDEAKADKLVAELNLLNRRRQTVTQKVVREAEKQLAGCGAVIVASGEDWPPGVVGLAANRLADKYGKPAVVFGRGGVGSARSPEGTNVLEILRQAQSMLVKLGGHSQAAGLTIDVSNLPMFTEAMRGMEAGAVIEERERLLTLEAEALVAPEILDKQTVRVIEEFAPFGEGNKRPQLVAQNIQLHEWRAVGKNSDHAKLGLVINNELVDGIGFGLAHEMAAAKITKGSIDILGELTENQWQGRRRLQFNVRDAARAGEMKITFQK